MNLGGALIGARVLRHSAQQTRERGRDGLLGSGRIRSCLVADLTDGVLVDVLTQHAEKSAHMYSAGEDDGSPRRSKIHAR
jgi:hypothetical protein